MTHGQFTIDDYERMQTLYTFHDGGTDDTIVELYSLMDYWVTQSADSVRWLHRGNPTEAEMQERLGSREWKTSNNCPGWCLIMTSVTRSPEDLQKILDEPGSLEESERSGIRYENTDAIGIAQLMTARHWNRWYPYPEDYRGYPGDDFLVKLLRVGNGTMDFEMHVEMDTGEDNMKRLFEKLKTIPGVKFKKNQTFPVVNFREQFWQAMRRELQTLVPYAGK